MDIFSLDFAYEEEYYDLILQFHETDPDYDEVTVWMSRYIIALMDQYRKKGRLIERVVKNALVLLLSLFVPRESRWPDVSELPDVEVEPCLQDLEVLFN